MSLFTDVINSGEEVITESIEEEVITEAVYPEDIPYIKLVNKKITLPRGDTRLGRGNICFLYTKNTNESIEIINNNNNFNHNRKYFYYYFRPVYIGRLYNKTYRIRLMRERKDLYKTVETKTKIRGYRKAAIDSSDNRNLYFDMSKFNEIFTTLCERLNPSKKAQMYWDYMKAIIFDPSLNFYEYKFILVNAKQWKMGDNLKENLNNPLFMLYYAAYKYPHLLKDFNIDMYFYVDRRSIKVNPSKMVKKDYLKLRREMTRLYSYIPNIEVITDEETIKKDEAVEVSVNQINDAVNKSEPNEIITKDNIEKYSSKSTSAYASPEVYEKIRQKANVVRHEVERIAPDTSTVPGETLKKAIQTKVENDIDSDKELLNEIYTKTVLPTLPKSTASSARDEQLKKAQKDIKIGNLSIGQIQKIQASHIEIPVKDVSTSVRTSNTNMTKIKFDNFEKTYNEKLMPKDITDAILSLNNKSLPMYVRDIKIQDTSDELNYKDTYTIYLEDSNRKRHTVKVDIPKFVEDKFLYIGGNKKLIKKQNLLFPVVKTSENIVQITTNYNKMFIERVGTKSIASIERLKKVLSKSDKLESHFTFGNALSVNKPYITTIEYDELSKIITKYKNGKMQLFFDQHEAHTYAEKNNITIPKNHLFIGTDNLGTNILININTQRTASGKSIVDLIIDSFDEESRTLYNSTKAPKSLMYAKAKVMSQYIAVGALLGFWEGLSSLLKKGKVDYRLEDKLPHLNPDESFIRFADCYLVYRANVGVNLLLNGYGFIDTASYKISEMDTKEPYMPYLIKVYGKASIANALLNVYEFMMDPITVEVCEDINLPTDLVEIIIYAVSLLSDSQFVPEINQGLSRIRSNEIIPAILYERLAKKYILYRNSGGKKPFSVPQDCVIKEVLALKTVEDYSTLNPVLELEMTHGISSKGFRGANLDESYTLAKRTYDKTCTGIISPSTSPDGSCGVSKTLTMNPSITSLRGYVDLKDNKLDELHDVDVFSPGELTIPLGATKDDATRLGHAIKQSKHVIPVKKSSPVLMSNGMEEVCRFELSSDFVVNAEEAGTVVAYDEQSKIMIVKYNSGKCRAVDLGSNIVKNGGGGFFLSNQLITTLKVGDKFKKDDVLAYHKDFFTNDKFNNCRMNMGTLTKVAIMSTYNTYQDATMITEKLSDDAATEMCFVKQATIGKNANVEYMVKKGQEIKVGDSLIQFDTSYEDNSLNTLLANLSTDEQESLLEGSRNDIHSKYSGVIEDIKIYSTVELEEMSPSLRKIVSAYYSQINRKKRLLEQYDPDSKDSIVKCGILLNETTKKIEPNKFGVIKGQKIEEGGVMIEFYIKHSEPLEIGSKIA
jgi:hypothetical protein